MISEPMPTSGEKKMLMEAEELCEQGARESWVLRNTPERHKHKFTYQEVSDWADWLEELHTLDEEEMASRMEECARLFDPFSPGEEQYGWVEDERGGAVFVPGDHCQADEMDGLDDEDDPDDD